MKEIENGQRVKIKFNISSARAAELACVVKWSEEDRIGLVFPDEKMNYANYLPEGKELEALMYTDKGIYVFDSIVINSPYEHDFVIELPDEKTRVQRREYVRTPLSADLMLVRNEQKINAKTINIGGGGIRFKVDGELNVNEKWHFVLQLPNLGSVKGAGELIYALKKGNGTISVIKFLNIDDTDRNKIIKICFDKESNLYRSRQVSKTL